jgi:fatty acid desaturase
MENQQTYEHDQPPREKRRRLPKQWWIVLVVIAFLAWASVGAMAFMRWWLWVLFLGALILAALLIALFAPRKTAR